MKQRKIYSNHLVHQAHIIGVYVKQFTRDMKAGKSISAKDGTLSSQYQEYKKILIR